MQQQGHLPPDFTLEAVECLSACRRFCEIALAAPSRNHADVWRSAAAGECWRDREILPTR
ncbi:MAG: hypothetical protein ACFCU8_14995 [Thermosynechococcaceae cyanobacterium]